MAPAMRTSRTSRPLRSSRSKVQSYYEESDPEDEPNGESEWDGEALGSTAVSLRPRRTQASYREDSSDDSFNEENDLDADDDVVVESPPRLTNPIPEPAGNGRLSRVRRGPTVATRSHTKRSTRSSKKRGLEIGRSRRENKKQKVEAVESLPVNSGVVPPWQTLPYQILFDIFYYASRPLVDKASGTRLSSIQWLVDIALLCRAFHEPALAALYYCPPLIPAARCHGLLSLLCRPQETLSTLYCNKIKVLDIAVERVLVHKSGPALGYFELPKLIEKTPQVKEIRLYNGSDYIVGFPGLHVWPSKWTYSESLFSSINSSLIVLRAWDWNSRFMKTEDLLPLIFTVHQQRAFQGLRLLQLFNLNGSPSYEETQDSDGREATLAAALAQLPELHSVLFRKCSIVNDHLLFNMQSALTSLTIDKCDAVNTSNLAKFLDYNGSHLRELTLRHNYRLNLSFLAGLADSCRRLERLKVDISAHDCSSYHDAEPHFLQLFDTSEAPSWPSTLQDIEFIQLRKWNDTAAEIFFASLVDAAPELRDLRRLVISAILKIGWRDRASFREKWIGKLETTFLRRSRPPNPNLNTLRPNAEPVSSENTVTEGFANSDAHAVNEEASVPSTPSKRKSARLAQRRFSEVEDQNDPKNERSMSSSTPQTQFVQGMCDVVMVRIDNQRPTETQFNENDFLDDEQSGDEDWNGNDRDIADEHER